MLWAGLATSSMGGSMQQFALGWLLVQIAIREGAPELAAFYIGLVGASRGIPGLAFGLLGGVFADRMDRRLLLIITRASGAMVAAGLAGIVLTDQASIAPVLALNVLGAISDAMDTPARQSLVAQILPPHALISAQGLTSSTMSAAGIFGPLAAGLLIGPIGIGGLMLVKTAAFVAAVVVLIGMEPVHAPRGATQSGVVRSLGEGLAFVMREPILRWVVILSTLSSLFGRPVNGLLPAYVQNTLHAGPTELSWLLAITGVGGLVGSVAAASLGVFRKQGLILLGGLLLWGASLTLFGLQTTLVPALLLVAFPQVSWFAFAAICQVLCQVRPPDHLRGRAISLYSVTISSALPLGSLTLGSLGTLFDVGTAFVIGGAVLAAVAVGNLVLNGAVRTVSVGRPEPAVPAEDEEVVAAGSR